VDLNDDQWAQAALPVWNGGLGIRSAQMLAPLAFLASAASTLEFQQSILPPSIQTLQTNPQRQSNSLGVSCQKQASLPANNPAFRKPGWSGVSQSDDPYPFRHF